MGLNIVICGAGIGGLAAAGYLRAKHNVTVLERGHLDFDTNDYGLSIVTNAFQLLQKAGIDEKALDNVTLTHIWSRNERNEEVKTTHFDANRIGGAPSVLARRARLQTELLRFATGSEFDGQPARIVEGAKAVSVDAVTGKVQTENGQTFTGDLIIGADGINSVVRPAVLNTNPASTPPQTHDILAYMCQISLDVIKSKPDFSYLADPTRQGGLVSIHTDEGPRSRKRILIYHISPRELQVVGYASEKEFASQFDASKSTIIKNISPARAVDEFKTEFPASLCDLFNHSQVDVWRIRDVDPVNTWSRGKAVLIGDAAHAVTPHAGQGCNISIEDAEALGFLLRNVTAPEQLPGVLEAFVKLRKDRTQFVQRYSRQLGNILSDEEKKTAQEITPEMFARTVYGYRGAEAAIAQSAQA